MRLLRGGLALALSLAAGCTCRNPDGLQPVPTFVRVEPQQVDFGRVIVGQVAVRTVTLVNSGRTTLEGQWLLDGAGFSTDDVVPTTAQLGSTPISVKCAPDHAGAFDGTLRIALFGFSPIVVPLSCEGAPVPECVPSASCLQSSWDVAAGRCVETPLIDGTTCAVSDVCLLEPTCRAGRCEGRLRGCDDADPCTIDSCDPNLGCQHSARRSCPGEGACRVGTCVAGQGCALIDAADGTPCGPVRTCTLADVCIAGACARRDPPDGFECAPEGPCAASGRCENDRCVVPPPRPLRPTWSLSEPMPDGGPPEAWSDLLADRDGALAVSSYFFSPPRVSADRAPLDLAANARRCVMWLGWLVCGDLPALASAPVSALDPRTGQTVWTFAGAGALIPQFVGDSTDFFTARLAVMNENELLVLYESRTRVDGMDTRCRVFGVVVLDRQGQPLRSRFLTDPIFQTCSHPHSYGVATDAQSNLYLAFSSSGGDNPATSLIGTTIFSFTPALQPRWRVFASSMQGGELSIGDGLLFQERSPEVRSTQTGAVVATLAAPFGLGVIGEGSAVSAGPGGLGALDTSTRQARWQRALGGSMGRAPLTVARWQSPWGPRDVALSFSSDGGAMQLDGTELLSGAAAFSCPVELRALPVMTAMLDGGVGVAIPWEPDATNCEDCDPKYARTRNSFGVLPVPGLTPSKGAWSGAWGDEGHSHHEGP